MKLDQDLWVVNVVPHAVPPEDEVPTVHLSEFRRLVSLWRKYIRTTRSSPSTVQKFVEEASRLESALKVLGTDRILLTEGFSTSPRHLGTGEEVLFPDVDFHKFFGMVPSFPALFSLGLTGENVFDTRVQSPEADKYFTLYTPYFGRKVALTGLTPDDASLDIVDYVYSQVDAHETRKFVIKGTASKSFIDTVTVPAGASYDEVESLVHTALGWHAAKIDGRSNSLFVQEWVEMEYEYRFFVVNNKIVTGAGMIHENTPLDNRSAFDIAVRRSVRGEYCSTEDNEMLVEQYREFANSVISETQTSNSDLSCYTLDVATVNGSPVVVERNSLLNSGFFASSPSLVLEALVLLH